MSKNKQQTSTLLSYIDAEWAVGRPCDMQRQPMGDRGQLQLVRYVSEEKWISVEGGRNVWEEVLVLGVRVDQREVGWMNQMNCGIGMVE